MTLLPPLVLFATMAATFSKASHSGTGELGLALTLGLVAVWQCPVLLWQKIVGCIVYAPMMAALLFGIAVSYVCGAYNDCF